MGTGTPATLYHIKGEKMPESPFMGKVEQHSKEFANRMSDLSSKLELKMQTAKTILDSGKNIGKKEKEALMNIFSSFIQEMGSNIPFCEQQFVEQMDKTIHEAKMQIDQHMKNTAHSLGIPMVQQDEMLSIDDLKTNINNKNKTE